MSSAQDKMKDKIPEISSEPTATMKTNSNDEDSNDQETAANSKAKAKTNTNNSGHLILKVWGVLAVLVVVIVVPIVLVGKSSSRTSEDGRIGLFDKKDKVTQLPSTAPSMAPSGMPSGVPSDMPSLLPSLAPSTGPTDSMVPSSAPTDSAKPSGVPSDVPSLLPTSQPSSSMSPTYFWEDFRVPRNRVPDNPPRGYFNYDINDRSYGPTRWQRVNTANHWLKEFTSDGWGPFEGYLKDKDPTLNRCAGDTRQQSPKNMVETIECDAGHEIRTRCPSYTIDSPKIQAKILPHKLSIDFDRRPCTDVEDSSCMKGQPPMADYPRYSSSVTPYSDLLHLDLKVPGEHTLEGESFDGEMQLFHIHLQEDPARVSSIGVPIRAVQFQHNDVFQDMLDKFQLKYDEDATTCRRRRQYRSRQMLRATTSSFNSSGNGLGSELDEPDPFFKLPEWHNETMAQQRKLQRRRFDPYDYALMPGMFFYRYDGSITEPPCMPITWWVMMEPMNISMVQLYQMKVLLFTHVDEDCRKTSVHNSKQQVTRPIEKLGQDRTIEKCSPGDFRSDVSKDRPDARHCSSFT